jgi:hypothetical protein
MHNDTQPKDTQPNDLALQKGTNLLSVAMGYQYAQCCYESQYVEGRHAEGWYVESRIYCTYFVRQWTVC